MAGLKDALKGKLGKRQLELLRRAFDVVGDIAILEIPDELAKKETVIAQAVLDANKNIKVVLKKEGGHSGRLRRQKMKHLAGEKRKETIAVENGVRLRLNVEKVYYSPRQATERQRILRQVKKGERVLVMFCGAGPYAIEIAKHTKAKEVIGVELNKDGYRYALENAALNKVSVEFVNADVRDAVFGLGTFDRILMPLPKSAEEYLDVALAAARKGATIHFYDFEPEEDIPAASVEKVKVAAVLAKRKVRVLRTVKCGQLGVRKYRVCVDFKVMS